MNTQILYKYMILLLHKLKIFCILFRGKKKTLCILCGFATSLHSKLSNPVILYPLFHLLFLISISLNELTNKWLGQWHCTCRSPMGNPFICFMKNQIVMKVVLAQVLCGVHSWSYQFKALPISEEARACSILMSWQSSE